MKTQWKGWNLRIELECGSWATFKLSMRGVLCPRTGDRFMVMVNHYIAPKYLLSHRDEVKCALYDLANLAYEERAK